MRPISNTSFQTVQHLAQTIGPRMSGTPANLLAREYIRAQMESATTEVEVQEYACPAWSCDSILLSQAGKELPTLVNPFSPSCKVNSIPQFVSTIKELEQADLEGQIVVLMGDLTSQVISCKSWFLIEERDQKIISLLEQKNPAAILTVQLKTGSIDRILEDWEFLIPSATISTETALHLLSHPEDPVTLQISSRQEPGSTANLVARIPGKSDEWITLMAHYDTKIDTPGAIDNATGVGILLALLDHFRANPIDVGLEFIVFAGEEYLPIGDDEYLRRVGEDHLEKIKFVVNFDGVGHALGTDSLAAIGCSQNFSGEVDQVISQSTSILPSDPWPESNHSTFSFRGVPALAYTSHSLRHFVHQLDDSIRWVDANKLQEVVEMTIQVIDRVVSQPKAWFRPEGSPEGEEQG